MTALYTLSLLSQSFTMHVLTMIVHKLSSYNLILRQLCTKNYYYWCRRAGHVGSIDGNDRERERTFHE
jgi:hypothetical protein